MQATARPHLVLSCEFYSANRVRRGLDPEVTAHLRGPAPERWRTETELLWLVPFLGWS